MKRFVAGQEPQTAPQPLLFCQQSINAKTCSHGLENGCQTQILPNPPLYFCEPLNDHCQSF